MSIIIIITGVKTIHGMSLVQCNSSTSLKNINMGGFNLRHNTHTGLSKVKARHK